MILSHSRKFIFIKTFKTAGSSLEIALTKYCGKDDVLTMLDPPEEELRRKLCGFGAQNFEEPFGNYKAAALARRLLLGRQVERFQEHSSAYMVREAVGEDVWNSYFKFTIIRNPFDRCVSRYFYSREHEWYRPKESRWNTESIDQFFRYNANLINENWKMYTVRDEVIVDFLVRYEALEADLAEVSARIGLTGNIYHELARIRAKADSRPAGARPADLLEPRHRTLISMLCAKEMEMAGYASEPEPT